MFDSARVCDVDQGGTINHIIRVELVRAAERKSPNIYAGRVGSRISLTY